MKSDIRIGKVEVPLVDYAIGASAVLGIRDSGKTVTSKGIAEQLLDNKIPIIVFDAVGKWRWLKVASDKANGKAFKVVVAGGRQPDLPLTPHSVDEIVRAALKERIPLVIDLFSKELTKADWRRIVQRAIHIIHYENEGGAVHVFLEEAAEFVPQKVYDGETYAEVEKLVRMGGNASVGITLINQRSQEVNKAVLDNCSTALVLGCQVGKNAIEAVEKWIERLDPNTADELTQSLPNLKAGEAWVWTRKSLTSPTREQMPMCRSFHPDRRTPEIVLKSAKGIDTEEFVTKLSDSIPKVIEEAKANDPAELKRTIVKLRQEITTLQKAKPGQKSVEVSILTDEDRKLLKHVTGEHMKHVVESFEKLHLKTQGCLNETNDILGRIASKIQAVVATPKPHLTSNRVVIGKVTINRKTVAESNGTLGKCERAILTALAQYPQGRTATQVAVLTGYSVNSGGFNNSLGKLRSSEFITRGQPIQINQAGIDALGEYTPLPTGEDLQRHWLNQLGRCESMILQVLLTAYPNALTSTEVAAATGYSSASGGFNNSLGKLRTLELITRGQPMRASEDFFQ